MLIWRAWPIAAKIQKLHADTAGWVMQGKLNSIAVPQKIADTLGHYSIVGLLPEDHTFSKGSLFLLAPGTKCVIFDLDGKHPPDPSCQRLFSRPFFSGRQACTRSLWPFCFQGTKGLLLDYVESDFLRLSQLSMEAKRFMSQCMRGLDEIYRHNHGGRS